MIVRYRRMEKAYDSPDEAREGCLVVGCSEFVDSGLTSNSISYRMQVVCGSEYS